MTDVQPEGEELTMGWVTTVKAKYPQDKSGEVCESTLIQKKC